MSDVTITEERLTDHDLRELHAALGAIPFTSTYSMPHQSRIAVAELLRHRAQAGWQPIETLPITANKDDPWATMNCLLYSKEFGVRTATIHRYGELPASGSVSNLHGDAINDWGATHWMIVEPPKVTP